jgi:hypothetical protein
MLPALAKNASANEATPRRKQTPSLSGEGGS